MAFGLMGFWAFNTGVGNGDVHSIAMEFLGLEALASEFLRRASELGALGIGAYALGPGVWDI